MQQNFGRASLSNYGRRRRCCREEGGARAYGCGHPSLPSLYIGAREGGGRSLAPSSKEGVRPRGEESILPKAPRRCLPPLGLFLSLSLGAWASWGWCPWPIHAKAHPLQPMWPSRQVAPPGGPPGPFRWSRYNTGDPETFPMAETTLPIYNSLPPDHFGTPRDVRDLIRDSEQPLVTTYNFP